MSADTFAIVGCGNTVRGQGGPTSYLPPWSRPLLVSGDGAAVAGTAAQPLADPLAGVDLGGMTLADPIATSADGSALVGHATCAGTVAVFRASLPR